MVVMVMMRLGLMTGIMLMVKVREGLGLGLK